MNITLPPESNMPYPIREGLIMRLMKSIKELGLVSSIAIYNDGVIFTGVHRFLACQRLGRPIHYIFFETGVSGTASYPEYKID